MHACHIGKHSICHLAAGTYICLGNHVKSGSKQRNMLLRLQDRGLGAHRQAALDRKVPKAILLQRHRLCPGKKAASDIHGLLIARVGPRNHGVDIHHFMVVEGGCGIVEARCVAWGLAPGAIDDELVLDGPRL